MLSSIKFNIAFFNSDLLFLLIKNPLLESTSSAVAPTLVTMIGNEWDIASKTTVGIPSNNVGKTKQSLVEYNLKRSTSLTKPKNSIFLALYLSFNVLNKDPLPASLYVIPV